MFGIKMLPDFSLETTPHVLAPAEYIRLRNLRLCGRKLELFANRQMISVRCDGRTMMRQSWRNDQIVGSRKAKKTVTLWFGFSIMHS
ncbi:MAG: hypothetical protein BWX73_01701 [Lentisphaerae bacterium ADurb.Bin082]|nr:MAG: hypothetical protein BWX73_01701 [Lentisphaerae bacterium ADurb.Bin082]